MLIAFLCVCSSGLGAVVYQYAPNTVEPATPLVSASAAFVPMISYVEPLYHVPANHVESILKTQFPDLVIDHDPNHQQLVFRCRRSQYAEIRQIIRKVDREYKQCYIHVQILELSSFDIEEYEQLLSQLSDGLYANLNSDGSIDMNAQLPVQLRAMLQSGQAKLLSRPTLSVLDHAESSVKVGDQVPYLAERHYNDSSYQELKYIDTGIDLGISVDLLNDDALKIDIDADMTVVKSWKSMGDSSYPVLSTRHANTEIQMNMEETLVLAGLFDISDHYVQVGIPILSQLPFIGGLFSAWQSERIETDIVFLIQPSRSAHPIGFDSDALSQSK